MNRLQRNLSEPAPVPEAGLRRAREIIRGGWLTRYGEFGGAGSEVAALERDFARYMGSPYALAVNSCGSALYLALLCAGVKPGEKVLLNAFTLAPVPGAIAHAGAEPLYVECDERYLVDLEDLERKADRGAKVLLLSYMRGHIPDMEAVTAICRRHGLTLIEDCAHTLGARWDGTPSGRFGKFGCFSLQAYKHINAGEGGLLITDDEDAAARAVLYAGSYMLYEQNGATPDAEVFLRHRESTPNLSFRMHEVTAALARPQIGLLAERGRDWNRSYRRLEDLFSAIDGVVVPPARPPRRLHRIVHPVFPCRSVSARDRGSDRPLRFAGRSHQVVRPCAAPGFYRNLRTLALRSAAQARTHKGDAGWAVRHAHSAVADGGGLRPDRGDSRGGHRDCGRRAMRERNEVTWRDNTAGERPNFVTHLECSWTGKRHAAGRLHNLSDDGFPLLVRYDLRAHGR